MDISCDTLLVSVPAYLLSRMRQIRRKRKIVIVFLCCGNSLTLFGIMIASIIIYGPFAESEDKAAFVDFLTHLSVRFLARDIGDFPLIEFELHRPRRHFYQPICSWLGRPSIYG